MKQQRIIDITGTFGDIAVLECRHISSLDIDGSDSRVAIGDDRTCWQCKHVPADLNCYSITLKNRRGRTSAWNQFHRDMEAAQRVATADAASEQLSVISIRQLSASEVALVVSGTAV